MAVQIFHGKGPHPLLWAGSQATRGKMIVNSITNRLNYCVIFMAYTLFGFGGLGVACWALVPKFVSSNPAEAVGFLRAKKILSTPSFGGEVKPSVPCRRSAAC